MNLGLNSFEVQKSNRLLVLKLMLEVGSITRAELAQRTGLKKSTITNIINEMLEQGIIMESGMTQPEYGRPGELLRLVSGIYIIAMAINRKNYKIGVFDLHGGMTEELSGSISIKRDISATIAEIRDQIQKIIDKYGKTNILAISLGIPGPYIRNEMDIAYVTGFEELSKINVAKEIGKGFDIPLYAEHDVKLSAYAEWKNVGLYSQAENPSVVVLSSIGIGIGAGIIINGSIVKGVLGIAGEIGNMGINFNGDRMEFGNKGSYEQYAGTDAACKYVLSRLHEFPDTELNEHSGYKDIIKAYHNGDKLAIWAMNKVAWMLGYGIANILYILNPNIIIIEADYPKCDAFIDKVKEAVKENVHPIIYDNVSIQPSSLEYDSELLGGYYLIMDMYLENQQLLDCIAGIVKQRTN